MDQGTLHLFFFHGFGYINRFSCERILLRVVDAGSQRAWGRIEILHLIRNKSIFLQKQSQFHSILQTAARMTGDQIRDQILLLPQLPVCLFIFFTKLQKNILSRLSHLGKYCRSDMLWRNFQCSAYMILAEFLQKCLSLGIRHEIIVADSRTDKHFLYAIQLPHRTQNLQIIAVIYIHIGTDSRIETVSVPADSCRQLLLAGRCAEIGSRSADIVNVSFKIFFLRQRRRFPYNRCAAPAPDLPSLVISQGAETASAKTSSGADDAEFHLLECRDSPLRIIGRVPFILKRQFVNIVQLFLFQRRLRRILHDAGCFVIRFDQCMSGNVIIIPVLHGKAPPIRLF